MLKNTCIHKFVSSSLKTVHSGGEVFTHEVVALSHHVVQRLALPPRLDQGYGHRSGRDDEDAAG